MAKKKAEVTDVFRYVPDDLKPLAFTLPIPPSVNSMHVNTRGGGRRLSYIANKYIAVSRAILREIADEQSWKHPERETWLHIDMIFYFPDRRIRDASNCLKILLDVMEGIMYINDYFALPRIQSVEYDKDNPRVEIVISAQSKQSRKKLLKTNKSPQPL